LGVERKAQGSVLKKKEKAQWAEGETSRGEKNAKERGEKQFRTDQGLVSRNFSTKSEEKVSRLGEKGGKGNIWPRLKRRTPNTTKQSEGKGFNYQ